MKHCPQCQNNYDDSLSVCPKDGTSLVAPADPLIGTILAGRYRLVAKIGQGGMGAIYKAVHTRMDRTCAIKLLAPFTSDPEGALARFNREAKMASRIDNPHACTIYDFGEADGGTLYLAMEFIDGRPLSRLISRDSKLEPARVAHITSQIAQALSSAHALDIVHRDLKPDNIMITRKGDDADYVKVLDFGIAKSVADDGSDNLTKTGFILGTPVYMSPEQLTGEDLDRRSDVYSLAIIVYEMLSGRLPFQGDNPQAVMIKRVMADPIPLRSVAPWVSDALEDAVMSALSRNRDKRTPTAEDFAGALVRAISVGTQIIGSRSTARMVDTDLAGRGAGEQGGHRRDAEGPAGPGETYASTLVFESQSSAQTLPDVRGEQAAGYVTLPDESASSLANTLTDRTDPARTRPDLGAAAVLEPAGVPTMIDREQPRIRKPLLIAAGVAVVALAVILYLVLAGGPSGFTVNVVGAPAGSQIHVNGVMMGTASADGTLTVSGLEPGGVSLRVTRDGFADFTADLTGRDGVEEELRATLLPVAISYNGEMVLIPAGEFVMGQDGPEPDEGPAHKVVLPAYYIDKYEVTNAEYKSFCDATGRSEPFPNNRVMQDYFRNSPDKPVIGVGWDEARAYAAWRGKRLPTEAEWEKAASWDPIAKKKRKWPWGDTPDESRANLNSGSPASVSSFGEGQSPYGVFGMAGNAAEWVAGSYEAYPGNQTANPNFGTKYQVVRGGSFQDKATTARTTYRNYSPPVLNPNEPVVIGFRCAVSADDAKLQTSLGAGGR